MDIKGGRMGKFRRNMVTSKNEPNRNFTTEN